MGYGYVGRWLCCGPAVVPPGPHLMRVPLSPGIIASLGYLMLGNREGGLLGGAAMGWGSLVACQKVLCVW